jgi:nitrite reductase/ring-hydroxylating ferredoxin subunit
MGFSNCCSINVTNEFDSGTPTKKVGLSRRDFLKVIGGVSAALAVAPFIGAKQYLIQVPNTFNPVLVAKTPDIPVNGSIVFWFPFITDPTYTNILIHLPPDMASKAGKEFVAYNRTCTHLQYLISYLSGSRIIGCPCHGRIYRPTDGWPIGGPWVGATAVLLVLLVVTGMFYYQFYVLPTEIGPPHVAQNITIYLVAQQWPFMVNGTIDTRSTPINVPVGDNVTFHVHAIFQQDPSFNQDGFFIQGLMDVPIAVSTGHDIVANVVPTQPGEYTIICTIYCGVGHPDMHGLLEVSP